MVNVYDSSIDVKNLTETVVTAFIIVGIRRTLCERRDFLSGD